MSDVNSSYAVGRMLDRIKLRQIAIAAVLLTLIPAVGYFVMSRFFSEFGSLSSSAGVPIGISDALYFSIVTEATLGYGDISPHGAARALASVQVLLGIVIAGLSVAKVTSLELRYSNALGEWIEACRTGTGESLVTFSRIYEVGGKIRYDGENFNANGNPLGTFVGELISQSGMSAAFSYSNRDSNIRYFTEGTTHHLFSADPRTKIWNHFHATCRDTAQDFELQFEGFRATNDEVAVIRGRDFPARRDLIRSYLASIDPEVAGQ